MERKVGLLSFLIVMIISLGVFTLKSFGKDEKIRNIGNLNAISEKIEEVLKNQKNIIARLEDIRAQQDIIRVRASRR